MADFVLDATQVGDVVTYIAPGFFAQLGYRARYPTGDTSPGEQLIVSVVLSLPLVALVNALINGAHDPMDVGYVLALTAGSFVLGYVMAVLRGLDRVKAVLAFFGYRIQPEGSIYSQVLKRVSPEAAVVVELKTGLKLSGTPRIGPEHDGDGIHELYLTHPEANVDGDDWTPVGAGLIVPVAEVLHISLSEDPTGAPVEGEDENAGDDTTVWARVQAWLSQAWADVRAWSAQWSRR